MKEQCVMAAGPDPGAFEFFVNGIIETNARVEPRPARRLTGSERDVGDLGSKTIAVRAQTTRKTRIRDRVGGAPGVEVLAGEHDIAVAAIGNRRLQAKRVELVGRIGGKTVDKA